MRKKERNEEMMVKIEEVERSELMSVSDEVKQEEGKYYFELEKKMEDEREE